MNKNISAHSWSGKLAARRKKLGITAGQLASRSRVSIATVNRVLAGNTSVSLAHIQAVAAALGLRVDLRSNHDVKTLRLRQALVQAKRVTELTSGNAALEGQGLTKAGARKVRHEVARRLMRSKHQLWAS